MEGKVIQFPKYRSEAAMLLSVFALLGCMENQPTNLVENNGRPDSTADLSQRKIFDNANRRVVPVSATPNGLAKASGLYGTRTDWSGTVEMVTWECSGSGNIVDVSCSVDPQYVLVGGGAWADYGSGAGALLTSSYPYDGNLTTWRAESKDHYRACYHTLHTYAIGMRLKDANGNYLSRATIFNSMVRVAATSTSSTNARYDVHLPNYPNASDYRVVGGGARANWTTQGQLLYRSAPIDQGWYGESHDLVRREATTITVYVIGLKPTIPGYSGYLHIQWDDLFSAAVSTAANSKGTTYLGWSGNFSCFGGSSYGDGSSFRFLTRMSPYADPQGGIVQDKDHVNAATGVLRPSYVLVEKTH
jgi:hypothetical protein